MSYGNCPFCLQNQGATVPATHIVYYDDAPGEPVYVCEMHADGWNDEAEGNEQSFPCAVCGASDASWDDNADELRCDEHVSGDEAKGGIQGEIRSLLADETITLPPAMYKQAFELLALPEESLQALVEAARLMVGAAQYGR